MKYRAEIDGLRAVAVVPVILFHAGFELFSGGFVGVDVFFVISGYLITTILINDIENQRFSLVAFYERRARRILPALFFVMLACIPFAWMWMLPGQLKDFSQSLLAVSLFGSNFLFYIETGYFHRLAEEKPLLHTWSLAVEEQYYVLFPVFLLCIWRFGKRRVLLLISLFAAMSFILSEWGLKNDATANFYLAPSRVWELFAGSIAAIIAQMRGVRANNALSLVGLAAIVVTIFLYDKRVPFPGVFALPPILGVVLLVLYGGKGTIAARILSAKPIVGIGLISYSAYLWHQPLFAFARIYEFKAPSPLLMLALSFLSIGLAFLSWRFVEKPFRNKETVSRTTIFSLSIAFSALMIGIGLVGHSKGGFPERLSNDEKWVIKNLDNEPTDDFNLALNRKGFRNDGKPKLLIIGDSFAKDLYEGLARHLGSGFNSLDIKIVDIPRRCKNVLADTPQINEHILRADSHCLQWEVRVGTDEVDRLIREADLILVRSYWDVLPTSEMPRLYDYIAGIAAGRVMFFGGTAFGSVKFNSIRSLTLTPRVSTDSGELKPQTNQTTELSSVDLYMRAKVLMGERNYFSVYEFFCSENNVCTIIDDDGSPITNDGRHLVRAGEEALARRLFADKKFYEIWMSSIGPMN